jgi:hypothetical protein
MHVTHQRLIRFGCTVALFLAATVLNAQQKAFDGEWQMNAAQSHVADGRSMTLIIASVDKGVKMTIKSKKVDGAETTAEFVSKLDGKPSDFDEGDHKSQITAWFDGSSLNASKEKGPPADVTSMWKFELSADKQTLTMTINHYEPAADDEKMVFTRKAG